MNIFTKRIHRLRRSFAAAKIDALLVTKPENIFYLSGFRGDDSFVFITPQAKVILSDSRYETELRKSLKGWKVLIRSKGQTLAELVNALINKKGVHTLGFEPAHISYHQYRTLKRTLSVQKIKPCHRLIETLRLVKDAHELAQLRDAIRVAERSLAMLVEAHFNSPHTEKELADYLEYTMRTEGADEASFPTIVASAERSALPHAVSSKRKIKRNEPLLIDFGAKKGGYCSDLTRTFFLGKITARFRELYSLVREAQKLAISIIKPGVQIGAVDKQVRQFFQEHKVEKHFIHALGHGIGLEVHESPALIYTAQECFLENMIVTVEPGLYYAEWGGIRIEDMVRVTATGCEQMTGFPLFL
jgi:Xaa-Pro aminopeptidase